MDRKNLKVRSNRLGGERGFALVVTLLVVVLMAVLVTAAVNAAMSLTREATADYLGTRAFYAAEAGAEHALAQVELALQDGFLDESELSAIEPPPLDGYEFPGYSIDKVGSWDTTRISDGPFAGLYSISQQVEIHSQATDASGAHAGVIVGGMAHAIPLFQFAGFTNGAIEAYTGSRSDTWGRVHANGDLYLATVDHHIHTVITTPGRFIRDGRVDHVDKWKIHVYIEKSDASEVEVSFDSEDTPDPETFKNRSESELDGRLRTGALGVDSLRLPLPPGMDTHELVQPREADDTQSERATKFAWQADMYVTVDLTDIRDEGAVCGVAVPYASKWPNITVERPFGGPTPDPVTKCKIFPFRWEAFFDWAQMKWVDAATVDIAELRNWAISVGQAPRVIYVEIKPRSGVTSSSATSPSGDGYYWPILRLRNGSTLPGPLTVGTGYPLYMQGHYNNNNKQPAAVFGDRLTGLSECWQDNNPSGGRDADYNQRDACDTYQYYSVITGESEGYLGCYHHGPDPGCTPIPAGMGLSVTVQNLEDWRYPCSDRCEYWIIGSFVTLWAPHISSQWGNYPNPNQTYRAPYRNWSFDPDLMDPANLPPATPNVGYVLRAAFREMY
jgi:type II secretory pathway pseudopilin PulG